ncbi:alkaline shock response membrane anchor protein AmaP [Dethiothermospora halolimnae]|uniref:alkaline shock response membrane anchor protein AmaP n=1 Tax=Dethiothermospora halolimnae TaxID=3114390 RepID=UPI003CCBE8E5
MKLFDRIILSLYTFCLALVSILIMIFPFKLNLSISSIDNVTKFLENIKGNYWYTLVGLAFFLVSIKFLISGAKKKPQMGYIVKHTKHGDLKISTETIKGLVNSVADKSNGISNIKTMIDLMDDGVSIKIKGAVTPDVNIPEITEGLQGEIKGYIEESTGINVTDVMINIDNITTPMRVMK